MNILIVEDEPHALKRLEKLVQELRSDANVLGTADSIESATELFTRFQQAELAFLDIELADGQSFEIFNRVAVKCPVIFTTAYDEYALQAFRVNSIDYLLKPVNPAELEKALQKFANLYRGPSANYEAGFAKLLQQMGHRQPEGKKRFLVKQGSRLIPVEATDIAYFYAHDKLVHLVTLAGSKYLLDQSLDELEQDVSATAFFRVNRQYLVQMPAISSINSYFNGKLKLQLIPEPPVAEEVLVSRERASAFRAWLDT